MRRKNWCEIIFMVQKNSDTISKNVLFWDKKKWNYGIKVTIIFPLNYFYFFLCLRLNPSPQKKWNSGSCIIHYAQKCDYYLRSVTPVQFIVKPCNNTTLKNTIKHNHVSVCVPPAAPYDEARDSHLLKQPFTVVCPKKAHYPSCFAVQEAVICIQYVCPYWEMSCVWGLCVKLITAW